MIFNIQVACLKQNLPNNVYDKYIRGTVFKLKMPSISHFKVLCVNYSIKRKNELNMALCIYNFILN